MTLPRSARLSCIAALTAGSTSGILYGLSLPKADLSAFAWIALLPILWYIIRGSQTGESPAPPVRHVVGAALTFGIVAGTFRVYWVVETLGLYGGLGLTEAVATTFLLILYLSLYPTLFGWLCRRCAQNCLAGLPWLAAGAWVLLDWTQTWMFSGFPWAVLGTSQYAMPLVAAFAALAGVHGISFVIVAVNCGLALLTTGRHRVAGAVAIVAPIVVLLSWGAWHAHSLSAAPPAPALRIGIVQGNIRQDVKWEPNWKQSTLHKYVDLTRRLAQDAGALDLIVWPETALPFRLDDRAHAGYLQAVSQLAQQVGTPLLVGSLGTNASGQRTVGQQTGSQQTADQRGLYNRAFLFDRRGQVAAFGDKVHLVPFGEYLPMPWLFDYMQELTAQSGAFDPGLDHAVIELAASDSTAAKIRLGLFVCYESIFPSITRSLASGGAEILINTTNDAWFGTTAAPYQHFAMVALRAIETGRPVVRAANTGISGAIGPDGRVLHATDLFDTTVLVADVSPHTVVTPYVRFGDVIVVLSGCLWGLYMLSRVQQRRRLVVAEIDAAVAALDRLAKDPVALKRPLVLLPGYDSSPSIFAPLRGQLERCFTGGQILEVDLRHNEPLEGLLARTRASLPAEPCDYIGHSLGGLVAAGLVRAEDLSPLVFALASPFEGTVLARGARWLRFPFRAILADLQPGAAATTALRRSLPPMIGFQALRLRGDPVRPGLAPQQPLQTFNAPMLLGPTQRHRAIVADPRAVLVMVTALRSRP